MTRRTREEHAVHRARAAESRPVALPVVFLIDGLQLGEQQRRILKDALGQQAAVFDLRLRFRQRLEGARVLERESIRQRRLPFAGRLGDTIRVIRRRRSDAEVIERPVRCRSPRSERNGRFVFPDPSDLLKRRIGMLRIEIQDRLEQDKWHTVEAHRVVLEPAPPQAWVLSTSESVLLGSCRIGITQVALERAFALVDLCSPVLDDLTVDPRHDVRARVVLQRRNQPRGRWRGRRRPLICGVATTRAHDDREHGDARKDMDPVDGHLKQPRRRRWAREARTTVSFRSR